MDDESMANDSDATGVRRRRVSEQSEGPGSGASPRPGPLCVERVTGIEPALSAWEADVLPLNYTREGTHCTRSAPPMAGPPEGHDADAGRVCGRPAPSKAGGRPRTQDAVARP